MAFQNMAPYYVAHDELHHLRSGSIEFELDPTYKERRLIPCPPQVVVFDRYENYHNGYTVDIHVANGDVRNGDDAILRICGTNENGSTSNAFLAQHGLNTVDLLEVPDESLPNRNRCEQLVFDAIFIGMHHNGQGEIYFFRRNAAVAYIQLHHVVEAVDEAEHQVLQSGFIQILGNHGSEILYFSLDPFDVYYGH
jgi:hypothetical protein